MNFSQMQARVYLTVGSDANDGLLTPTLVGSFINDALHAVEQESDWPWLETSETLAVLAGVDTYAPGAVGGHWLRTRWIEDDVQKVLEWYSREEMGDRWRSTTVGKPVEFSVYADTIYLRPVPDAAYTYRHFYQQSEVDLVSPTDVPLMPATYHQAIIDYASYLCFKASREVERANLTFQEFQDRLAMMKQRAKRSVDQPGKVRIRPGSWL